ncbi:AmmeMemoRadiSam system protein B [Candidatus Falkowbacteria bacterium CG10_big_fil_rev_8_21_14_0_10_39_11]|uniref:AmmeMemoRadiSam system protein B n=1 Tax=Candidatus Falkowbacteria bacterium CG10_big_fil_rev_8_21_14_0_10_39_11 TaxID=1974565 RepID=A0A2H0V3K7_9BACT|nr:MAG: AmmeMemoRadiSam system protein B [Candidatus Falkowbacteria bacterium CG10_big_fil_rev_8_21_14_0_10_39_11]
MTKTNKILIILVILLVIVQGGLLFFVLGLKSYQSLGQHRSLYVSKSFYDDAFSLAGDGFEIQDGEVVAVVVPHHLFVKDRIATLFRTLEKSDFDTIVMVGPDHLNDARYEIVTSGYDWQTPYGQLKGDPKLVEKFLDSGLVSTNEAAMAEEFSISGLTPFVQKTWPRARFVPIIMANYVTPGKLDEVIDFISKNVGRKTLFIASVDFSHYRSAMEAEAQDEQSIAVIQSFDLEKVFDLDVDSPQSIYTILKLAENFGATSTELLSHTNTGLIQPENPELAVTHNIFIFTK